LGFLKKKQIKLVNFKVSKELGVIMNEEFIVQVRELLDLDLYVATLALAS
jgi:hypothetical protein